MGYVAFIDSEALSEITKEQDVDIDVHVLAGTFVYLGSVLACVPHGDRAMPNAATAAIRKAFTIAKVRTYDQDPRFGLVVLTEVALRALSPAVNDPGTAIDVIGRQTRLLSFWGNTWRDAERTPAEYPRIRVPALRFDDMFEDAFNLIGRDAAGQIDVLLRLVKALQALSETGPEEARAAARQQMQVALQRAGAGLQNEDDLRRLQAVVGAPDTVSRG